MKKYIDISELDNLLERYSQYMNNAELHGENGERMDISEWASENVTPSLTLPDHGEEWEPMAVLEIESRKVNEHGTQWRHIYRNPFGDWWLSDSIGNPKIDQSGLYWDIDDTPSLKRIKQPIRFTGRWQDSLFSIEEK